MKSGKYHIAVVDENTFEVKVNISFIELLKGCEKEGVDIKRLLEYARERDANNEHYRQNTTYRHDCRERRENKKMDAYSHYYEKDNYWEPEFYDTDYRDGWDGEFDFDETGIHCSDDM